MRAAAVPLVGGTKFVAPTGPCQGCSPQVLSDGNGLVAHLLISNCPAATKWEDHGHRRKRRAAHAQPLRASGGAPTGLLAAVGRGPPLRPARLGPGFRAAGHPLSAEDEAALRRRRRSPRARRSRTEPRSACSAATSRGRRGKVVAQVVNVLVDGSGRPLAAVLDYGGFMGVGRRRIAVAWRALSFAPGGTPGGGGITLCPEPGPVEGLPGPQGRRADRRRGPADGPRRRAPRRPPAAARVGG